MSAAAKGAEIRYEDLTEAERAWLERLAAGRWMRCAGGWRSRGVAQTLTLKTYGRLYQKNLVRRDERSEVVLTGSGRNFLAVWQARRDRRRA